MSYCECLFPSKMQPSLVNVTAGGAGAPASRTSAGPPSFAPWSLPGSADTEATGEAGGDSLVAGRPAHAAPSTASQQSAAVRLLPATDPASVARASQAYLAKYAGSPYAASMVRAEVLPTTLRVVPA